MSTTTVRRIARKPHRCWDGGGCLAILPGDAYLLHTSFPGDDSGYADTAGHPVRMAECAAHAARYQRDHLLDPMPAAQHERYVEAIYQMGLV